MSRFSIRNPYFVIVVCLVLAIGVTSVLRMPVDLFSVINLPEVVVAAFYSGMPPEHVETDITDPIEPSDLKMVVSNIGVVNDFSSLYTTNAGQTRRPYKPRSSPGASLATIIGGLTSSVLLTLFIVPAAYLLVYGRKSRTTS